MTARYSYLILKNNEDGIPCGASCALCGSEFFVHPEFSRDRVGAVKNIQKQADQHLSEGKCKK